MGRGVAGFPQAGEQFLEGVGGAVWHPRHVAPAKKADATNSGSVARFPAGLIAPRA
jgi:hypothetical protein